MNYLSPCKHSEEVCLLETGMSEPIKADVQELLLHLELLQN
jgi:hypothetical protein